MASVIRGWFAQARCTRSGLIALVLLLSSCQSARTPANFHNPLNEVNGADPWLVYHDGFYYLTATQWSAIRMWKSPTIAGLASVAPVTIWSDAEPSRCCNVWAPEFFLLDGPNGPRWYVYYTAGLDATLDQQRMHVLESSGTDPLGPYTYKGRIFDPQNDGWAIDASILNMSDGALYVLFSAWVGPDQSLFIAPMSNPWTISGSRVLLSKPTYDWERSLANVNEGPEVLQHDGKIFIIYSASACWGPDYRLGMLEYNGGDVLSATSWVKHAQPVFERSDANSVYGPGHNGFFTSPDGKEHWIVYHANAATSDGCTGERTTRVQKFTWNADGTPNFGTPLSLDTAIAAPAGERGTASTSASEVYYTLVGEKSQKCLSVAGASGADEAKVQQQACTSDPNQQWSLNYLGNGYYSLLNRGRGTALEVAGGPGATQDGADIQQGQWAHTAHQQWRLLPANDGWVRIMARHSDKAIDLANCGTDDGTHVQQASRVDSGCQQFRLQPMDQVEIVNANSGKLVTVDTTSTAGGTAVLLSGDVDQDHQRWSFVHQGDGYYWVTAAHSSQCLGVTGSPTANGAKAEQQSCASSPIQHWRIEPLNDGMFRLVAREGGKVLDASNCRMADGTSLQQWAWLDNLCQRFRLVAP